MSNIFYKIYHGNLAFSAIEEESLGEVIDKTYFPLLELIDKNNLKVGLELSGYSLEKIQELRPSWIKKFKELEKKDLIELIGSGYMQIIAPIVPFEVNLENQKFGLEVYQNILGIIPEVAYINEQVFSSSLIDVYYEVGYKAISMEWNNAYSIHRQWKKSFAFTPVIAEGLKYNLPILWTDSIIFQQFQRMAHSEIMIDEYIDMLKHHLDFGYQTLPIYSSDLEIFNYRPGRFETEATINTDEWSTISKSIKKIKELGEFCLPSEVVDKYLNNSVKLCLTNSANPILVKKQSKYSLSRWSACGRGANYINTLCYKYFLQKGIDKKLLQYWGSDYRTHTTIKKWNKAIRFLTSHIEFKNTKEKIYENDITLIEKNNKLIIKQYDYIIEFNQSKGMSLECVYKKDEKLQFGRVSHGDLDYISNGADFYTGTTIIESVDTKKISNLHKVEEYKFERLGQNKYLLSSVIKLKDIAVEYKDWIIDFDSKIITLNIKLKLDDFIKGSIRLGTFTLLPQEKNSVFWYECKNGGKEYERYYIDDSVNIEHSQAKSLLQSSNGGIGATDGVLRFGIENTILCEINIDRSISYPFVMLQNSCDHDKYLTRVYFGVQELDDTLKVSDNKEFKVNYTIKL